MSGETHAHTHTHTHTLTHMGRHTLVRACPHRHTNTRTRIRTGVFLSMYKTGILGDAVSDQTMCVCVFVCVCVCLCVCVARQLQAPEDLSQVRGYSQTIAA